MATLTVQLPERVKALAEKGAAAAGCAGVDEYLAQLIVGAAAGAPEGLRFDTIEQLEALLASRADGPFVEMDAADFRQIREKLKASLDAPARPTS